MRTPTSPLPRMNRAPVDDDTTVRLPSAPDEPAMIDSDRPTVLAGRSQRRSVRSMLCGVVLVVLVLLAVGMLLAQFVSQAHGTPGPGAVAVGSHIAAALVAMPLYLLGERRKGLVRWLATMGMLVVLGVVLWFFWWAS